MKGPFKQAVRRAKLSQRAHVSPKMAPNNANQKITSGVFAIHKPTGLSSAQVIRNVQTHFSPSAYFSDYMVERRKSVSKKERRMGLADRVKMGHGGTLDPLATGVLILGIDNGTKQLERFLSCTKSYETVVLFGAATDTYDRMGKIIGRKPFGHITKAQVENALSGFRGKIMQQPPIFSALNMDGKRLYQYAREGKELPREIAKRPVEVLEMEMTEWMEGGSHAYAWPVEEAEEETKGLAEKVLHFNDISTMDSEAAGNLLTTKRKHDQIEQPSDSEEAGDKRFKTRTDHEPGEQSAKSVASFHGNDSEASKVADASDGQSFGTNPPAARIRMTVTSGFYVRSLCHDLGAAVGSLALMSELVRTRQGDFELGKNVLEYDALSKGEDVWAPELQSMLEKWQELEQD